MLAVLAAPANAVVVFQDDFNDGNAAGWTFVGNDSAEWGVLGGRLNSSTGSHDRHDGFVGFALIDGLINLR
ncbi:MAG: hypothetical protein ACI9DC_000130 [Gammaproteobacteria bacterium]|jgi:hypothetical protein